MATWIGLLRGINVGGNNILSMAKLKHDLESIKLGNVRTYIQSGNFVFESSAKTAASLERKIADLIEDQNGFRPQVLVFSRAELGSALKANPFPMAVNDPKSLHFFFLSKNVVNPDLSLLSLWRSSTESFELKDRVFYLHAPDGIGRSKLAANLGKVLPMVVTARNYRTVDKLFAMASQADS